MITAIVKFNLPKNIKRTEIETNMRKIAPNFKAVNGLIRKNFIIDDSNQTAGGVYTWKTLEEANKFYAKGGKWRRSIIDLYGADPEIALFDTPILVDNSSDEIIGSS